MISQRLKQLRIARGLSLDDLATLVGGVISRQSLWRYEQGEMEPPANLLHLLAVVLGVDVNRLSEEPLNVEFIAYRTKSGLVAKEDDRIKSLAQLKIENRLKLQDILDIAPILPHLSEVVFKYPGGNIEKAAKSLREQWGMGDTAVPNLIDLMESHCIHVIEIDADDKWDGISAVVRDEEDTIKGAVAVVKQKSSGDRQRFTLAHELGHIVLQKPNLPDDDPARDKLAEQMANQFAGAFLIPKETLHREVGISRKKIEFHELCLLKKHFGVSIQALLMRMKFLGIITEAYNASWFIALNRMGYRKVEPVPIEKETTTWLERHIYRALAEEKISRIEAEKLLERPLRSEESFTDYEQFDPTDWEEVVSS